MSAKKQGTAVTVAKTNAVAIAVPDYLKGFKGRTGTEGIDSNDVTIPRIKLGQGTSDEVKDGTVKEGALFLNITKEVLAEPGKPLRFVLLARNKEFILWRPRKDNNGGILARARATEGRYKWDKPNTTFDVKVEGVMPVKWSTKDYIDEDGLDAWGSEVPGNKDSGIAATAHHNYIVVLPDHGNMLAALSLSRSQVKKAKDFNALLKLGGNVPIWARLFDVVSTDEQNSAKQKYKNLRFDNAGFVNEDQFKLFASQAAGFAGKNLNVDHSDGEDNEKDERN